MDWNLEQKKNSFEFFNNLCFDLNQICNCFRIKLTSIKGFYTFSSFPSQNLFNKKLVVLKLFTRSDQIICIALSYRKLPLLHNFVFIKTVVLYGSSN